MGLPEPLMVLWLDTGEKGMWELAEPRTSSKPLHAWSKAEDSSHTDGRGPASKPWPAGPVGGTGWPEIVLYLHPGWSPTWAGAPCGAGVSGSWQSTAAAGAATELSCRAVTPMPCTAAACGLPLVYHKGGGFQLCFPEGGKAVLLWSGKRGMCWGQSWILLEELPELGTLLWEALESLCKRQAHSLLQGAKLPGIHQTVCEGTVCLFIRSSCWLLLKLEFMMLS